MTAWYIGEPIRNGSDGLGVTGVIVTSKVPRLGDLARDQEALQHRERGRGVGRIGEPLERGDDVIRRQGRSSWNLTPWRIVKTDDLPLPSGVFHAVAISGFSWPVAGLT